VIPEAFILLTVLLDGELVRCAVHVRNADALPEGGETLHYWREEPNRQALLALTPWPAKGQLVDLERIEAITVTSEVSNGR